MDWGNQQLKGLDCFHRWWKSRPSPYFLLAGYAGTGKTTIAKHLMETLGGRVAFATYTGKAANVLIDMGLPAARVSTIHKLIYIPRSKSKEKWLQLKQDLRKESDPLKIRVLNQAIKNEEENLSRPMFQLNYDSELSNLDLLIIDEYSMIDKVVGKDLLGFNVPILALGDPGQLPPIGGRCYFDKEPDVLLTEIHRQARDNPIIRMSQDIRNGKILKCGRYGDSLVLNRKEISQDLIREKILQSDQLLVGRNITRKVSNHRMRELKGWKSPWPEKGEKIICLRNNYNNGLFNGQMWNIENNACLEGSYLLLSLSGDNGEVLQTTAHKDYFEGTEPDMWTRKDADEFDYGYAITVHKSQGSQWKRTTLLDEWRMRDRKQWLYTAVTRAAERITVIKM